MNITPEQEQAVHNGQTVTVTIAGQACVLLRKDVYERDALDYSPWTAQEMDMLAVETANQVQGDGFDEPDAP